MTIKWPEARGTLLAWIVAGFCILALCILATFPYEMLQMRLVAELKRATGLDVRVADWTMGLPPSLEWRQVTFSKPNVTSVEFARLHAKLGTVKALSGALGLDLLVQLDPNSSRTNLAKGSLTASSFSLAGPVTANGQLQQVDLSKLVGRYVTKGTLNGTFSHRVESGQSPTALLQGEGTWSADATDLVIDQIPLGNGRSLSLTFSLVSAGLACRNGLCEVTHMHGEGIDGSFTGEGRITLQQPILNSQLALTVTVVPGPGFASKAGTLGLPSLPPGTPIPIKLIGTLAQARITL